MKKTKLIILLTFLIPALLAGCLVSEQSLGTTNFIDERVVVQNGIEYSVFKSI